MNSLDAEVRQSLDGSICLVVRWPALTSKLTAAETRELSYKLRTYAIDIERRQAEANEEQPT